MTGLSNSKNTLQIFESEPEVVYEYAVENTNIDQVGMWTISGLTAEERGIKPQHDEKN